MEYIKNDSGIIEGIAFATKADSLDIDKIEALFADKIAIGYIDFSSPQEKSFWVKLNGLLATHPYIRLSFNNAQGWGTWKDISFLEDLTHAHILTINEWLLEDLSPISSLVSIKRLAFINDAFKSSKVSLAPLHTLKNLEDLSCSGKLKGIEVISHFTKLEKLSHYAMGKGSLEYLQNNHALKKIYLRGSDGIRDFSGLGHLKHLEEMTLIRNYKIENLDFLTALKSVKKLYISDFNKIQTLPSLALEELKELRLVTLKNIKQLQGIADAINLEELSIYAGSKALVPSDLWFIERLKKLRVLNVRFDNAHDQEEFNAFRKSISLES